MAGIECLFMPFGTMLGVFTILVLVRATGEAAIWSQSASRRARRAAIIPRRALSRRPVASEPRGDGNRVKADGLDMPRRSERRRELLADFIFLA